jgi:N-acetylneuraminic acid mutarotase
MPAVLNNGFVYVIGGQDVGGNPTSSVLFGPISATGSISNWSSTAALPSSTYDMPAVVNNGFIYVIGGLDSGPSATSSVLFTPVNSDNSLAPWSNTTALPLSTYRMPTVVNNGFAYVIGGRNSGSASTSSVLFASLASRNLYWGVSAAGATVGGAYSSTVTYTAVFSP